MAISFSITRLDIMQSYFVGRVGFRGDEYTVNIQPQKRGKVLKLPFKLGEAGGRRAGSRAVVRLTGAGDLVVEDYLPHLGESEWLEIDSDEITYFLADHQDRMDTIEVAVGGG